MNQIEIRVLGLGGQSQAKGEQIVININDRPLVREYVSVGCSTTK